MTAILPLDSFGSQLFDWLREIQFVFTDSVPHLDYDDILPCFYSRARTSKYIIAVWGPW